MDFSTVKKWVIPEGEAVEVRCGSTVLWQKPPQVHTCPPAVTKPHNRTETEK